MEGWRFRRLSFFSPVFRPGFVNLCGFQGCGFAHWTQIHAKILQSSTNMRTHDLPPRQNDSIGARVDSDSAPGADSQLMDFWSNIRPLRLEVEPKSGETIPIGNLSASGFRFRSLRLSVRTPPFHGGESGSIPLGSATFPSSQSLSHRQKIDALIRTMRFSARGARIAPGLPDGGIVP